MRGFCFVQAKMDLALVNARSVAEARARIIDCRVDGVTLDEDEKTLLAANNYAMVLLELQRFEEAKKVLRRTVPVARRVLGAEHALTLSLREDLSRATLGGASSAEEKREALRILEEVAGVMRRVFGPAHPETLRAQRQLEHYRGSH